MSPSPASRRGRASGRIAFAALALVTAIGVLMPGTALGIAKIHPGQGDIDGFDKRVGRVLPTSAQRSMVSAMNAAVDWNRFGTPKSLIRYGGYLATGLQGADAASVARAWVTSKRSLFRMTSVTSSNLQTLSVSPLRGTDASVVLFRQRFGSLWAGSDGMIHVALRGSRSAGWRIAYVSGSAVGTAAAPSAAVLTPQQAWLKAAADVGRVATPANIMSTYPEHTWTVFPVAGFTQHQRARLVAVPLPGSPTTIRPAYEVNVVDFGGGKTLGVTSFVDAINGKVLIRHDRVQEAAGAAPTKPLRTPQQNETVSFTGATTDTACGPDHDFTVQANVKSVLVFASYLLVSNDIVIKIIRDPDGARVTVASTDNSLSPEVARYAPAAGVPTGPYAAVMCPLPGSINPNQTPPWDYAGMIVISDQSTNPFPYPPKWRYFQGNPPAAYPSPTSSGIINPQTGFPTTDTRTTRCWETIQDSAPVPGCTSGWTPLRNLASRAPWDVLEQDSGESTFTTIGNNANTAEAWYSPPTVLFGSITPGALNQRPVDANRQYIFEWTNQWFEDKCDPAAVLVPGGNDIFAATTQLFAQHNRMHDYSYWLGFTETNSTFQTTNYGLTSPERQNDPEVGDVQAGAVTGGPTGAYGGRDNANQLTLQDGVPGITNQYLFQAIPTIFYAPCVDGDYDQAIVGHEYTHGISNRMVGGPDASITSNAGLAMGESWSDLVGAEYLLSHYLVPPGQNPLALGVYATGNNKVGIRNYALDKNAWNPGGNPLNYSNVGFDVYGFEEHSDGEIWNAINWDIRKALVAKYQSAYPTPGSSGDRALQLECSDGTATTSPLPANRCPGNRRWIQIVFDAFVMMPGDVEMTGARDAYLAADMLRFSGANQNELWRGFASRGLGCATAACNGSTDSTTYGTANGAGDDYQPRPSFSSPRHSETLVTFSAHAVDEGGKAVKAKIYVGKYEARTTPVADTDGATALSHRASFVPGTYEFLAVAPGYGHVRFTRTLSGTGTAIRIYMPTNWASRHALGGGANGATAAGSGTDHANLIDDTEATLWSSAMTAATDPAVVVNLAGGAHTVRRVRVSALPNPDDNSGFLALRRFAVETCLAGGAVTCTLPTEFQRIYTSPTNFFPGSAPRPLAPDLSVREVAVPATPATHVRFVALENQCSGNPLFQTAYEDNDPTDVTDCREGSLQPLFFIDGDASIQATDFQVVSGAATTQAQDPVVVMTATGPATAEAGSPVTYSVTYRNLGPAASSNARITTVLPAGLAFRSASGPGTESYSSASRTVSWNVGTVPVGATGTIRLNATVASSAAVGTVFSPIFEFTAPLTVANPATAITLVL